MKELKSDSGDGGDVGNVSEGEVSTSLSLEVSIVVIVISEGVCNYLWEEGLRKQR